MRKELSGQSFNFGPPSNFNYKVIDLVKELSNAWEGSSWEINQIENKFAESKLLKLNCDKALSLLNWEPTLDFKDTIRFTSEWYYSFYNNKNINILEKCRKQINEFSNIEIY